MSATDRPTAAPVPGSPLTPTFHGYIGSTMDALILFEACLSGVLHHVPRRPHDRERANLIVSGNVFIYEESSSGIKRWTDGVPWSPSRILGNFLLYRELDKPFQPGEKKRAMKRQKPDGGISKPPSNSRANSIGSYGAAALTSGGSASHFDSSTNARNETERALVGSLVDSYQFKQDGLVKKTISVTYRGVQHHMVSYYSINDVVNNKLRRPADASGLQRVNPRSSLISSGNFRAPIDDQELVVPDRYGAFVGVPQGYNEYTMNGAAPRSMSMPSMHANAYGQPTWGAAPGNYAPGYTMGQALPPIPPNFTPHQTNYSYEPTNMQTFGMDPRPSTVYPPHVPQPQRRYQNMNGVDGVGQVEYPAPDGLERISMGSTQLLPNGNGLNGHSMASHSPYSPGTAFEASAASVAAATGSSQDTSHSRDLFEHATPNQYNDLYNPGVHHQNNMDVSSLHNPVTTGAHQGSTSFITTLPEQPGHAFTNSSHDTTPPMSLGLENPEPGSVGMTDGDWTGDFGGHDDFAPQLVLPPLKLTTG